MSAAASETLLRNIDYLVRETYNLFCHSTLRQTEYANLQVLKTFNFFSPKVSTGLFSRSTVLLEKIGIVLKLKDFYGSKK